MNKIQIHFSEIDSDTSFSQLAQSLGSKLIDGITQIPADNGSGIIKKIKFEEGLYMRVWDINLNKTIILSKASDPFAATEKIFNIACVLTPDTLLIRNRALEKEFNVQGGMNILLFSNDAAMDFEIPAGNILRAIDISVTSLWLINAFKDADLLFVLFISQLNENPDPIVVFESTSAIEYRTLSDLHTAALSELKSPLHIKARALSFVSDFFSKIFRSASEEISKSNIFHYAKMLEVEKILIAHLQKTLPSIEIIAREVALSESTLKRHFKLMFGKSIYEYYLEMKMDLAKRLLLEKPLSVNEVAAILDYEKVSNFIDMFKKHHGFSPGSMRKKNG
jgi:AraC-like DNA-binding protein